MELFTFYYTLVVMLFMAFASASCFSSFLVSRRKSFAYGLAMLAAYFFDVSIVFYHDFVAQGATAGSTGVVYDIQFPAASIVLGVCAIGAFWLLICEKQHNGFSDNKVALAVPPIAFAALSIAAFLLIGDPATRSFAFFGMRQLFLFFIFGAYFTWDLRTEPRDRQKIRPKPADMAVACLLTVGIIAEDVFVNFFLQGVMDGAGGAFVFFSERSLFENLLFIWLGIVLMRDAWKTLGAHYNHPPDGSTSRSERTIETMLPRYGDLHDLTPREREILRLILLEKDNRNIATEFTLTMGTVKVHVHNILRKTNMANRQELIQDFWKMR